MLILPRARHARLDAGTYAEAIGKSHSNPQHAVDSKNPDRAEYSEAQAEQIMWEALCCTTAVLNHDSGIGAIAALVLSCVSSDSAAPAH